MTENEICKGCPYNHYPECYGTKMFDGNYMNIENLLPGFQCGQKDELELKDFSISIKTPNQIKIEELEARIMELEKT